MTSLTPQRLQELIDIMHQGHTSWAGTTLESDDCKDLYDLLTAHYAGNGELCPFVGPFAVTYDGSKMSPAARKEVGIGPNDRITFTYDHLPAAFNNAAPTLRGQSPQPVFHLPAGQSST